MPRKIWITKYAFTMGIVATQPSARWNNEVVTPCGYVWVSWKGGSNGVAMFRLGRDAHCTEAEAKARVLAMIAAKRKTLAAQLAKLAELEAAHRV